MEHILHFIRSYYRITLVETDGKSALDFLISQDIPFHGLENENGTLSFCLFISDFKRYRRLRAEERFAGERRELCGLFAVLRRYKGRVGLAAGAVLALALIICSSFFVWDITVTGTEHLSDKEILDALEENGVKLGAYIPSLDTEEIEQKMILDVDGLSWISLNLRGTVAAVEVRERSEDATSIDTQAPSNLVAAFDGQIEALEVTGGVAAVARGQIVKKGDLLVSGIIDSNALGYRLVRARGEVTARVTLTYTVEIPYQTTEKVYTGSFEKQKSVKIFSKTLNLFGKDSISYENCDRIETEKRVYLFGKIKLPVFVRETTYAEYEWQEKTLTESEALARAYEELYKISEAELENAEILARHTHISESGDRLVLREEVECILNIAEEVKIETG